ncbi:hypothetical protein [Pseudomonas luteola]|uniref:hypothetical protein n=1 Tax=Pseudomonas TaxID=286 RepID=UPI0038906C3B
MDYVDGTHYLCELIKNLSDDRNAGSFHGEFTVTATVGGRTKVDGEVVGCQLVIQHDSVDVNIFWEDFGYKGYREMGLYGKANSKYQNVQELSQRSFEMKDARGAYELVFEW